jgi:hypothetical protein
VRKRKVRRHLVAAPEREGQTCAPTSSQFCNSWLLISDF